MISRLLFLLHDRVSGFNVFRYITFRAALAAVTALLLSLLVGPWLIRRLKEFQIGQSIREEGPSTHQSKKGTPTMGGLLILISIIISTLFWADVTNPLIQLCLASTAAFGLIGFLDDYQKLARKRNLGLTAGRKMSLQVLASAGIGVWLVMLAGQGDYDLRLGIPFFKNFTPDLGIWYVPFAMMVLVGAANAVNLTDGLDGLAIGATGACATTFTAVAYVVGHARAAEYLGVAFGKNAGELTVFCAAIAGAGLGFLWFNAYPAEVFMGDVGALGLGAALGAIAVIVRQEIVLFVMGGVFVVETLSVVIQVASFKLTGRRVFRMAPLHHHYELKGWKENQVVVRFWIITMLLVLFGLSTLKLR